MHPQKEIYLDEIYQVVDNYCQQYADNLQIPKSEVLNINTQQNYDLLKKILIALPDNQFYRMPEEKIPLLLLFIAKQYLLFQSQEDINNDNYSYHFIAFISQLVQEINQRFYGEK